MRKRWAILISGRGSNLQAALDLIEEIDVRLVVSSKAAAPGVTRARRMAVPVEVLATPIDWQKLQQTLQTYQITHIFLLGFMKIVPPDFVTPWQGRIFNVHPSLLPEFPGLKSIERNHQAGKPMGVTVHAVTAEMDAGKKILQKVSVPQPQHLSLAEAKICISVDEQRLVTESLWRAS